MKHTLDVKVLKDVFHIQALPEEYLFKLPFFYIIICTVSFSVGQGVTVKAIGGQRKTRTEGSLTILLDMETTHEYYPKDNLP